VSRRTSSGEVINATLLEVFLALVFIVFGLAVWKQQEVDEKQKELISVRKTTLAEKVWTDSIAALLKERERNDSIAKRAIDSVKFMTREPANCEADGLTPEFLTIVLRPGPSLVVTVNRSILSHEAGSTTTLTSAEFEKEFRDVKAYSAARLCYYRVRVRDMEGTSKTDYKRALAAIYTTFRPKGFLE
jgi:hypothetical protein